MSSGVPREDGSIGASKFAMLRRAVALLAVASALSGCGGSGSGGNASIASSAQLVVSPPQVDVTAQTTDPAPTALIQVSVQLSTNANAQTRFTIGGSYTKNGIDSASSQSDGSYGEITLTFKTPASLGPGTYTDSVTITGCMDQACTQPLSNSPQTVSVTYTVTQPQSQISSISPAKIIAGAPSFTLTVNGSAFLPNSVVLWNGSPLTTTEASSNQLLAQVPASDIRVSGNDAVAVSDGSGDASVPFTFVVTPLPQLSLTRISPSRVAVGGATFMLTAVGTGFASTSSIAWNGTSLPTTYVSSTMLRAQVMAAQIANVGTAGIGVVDSASRIDCAPLDLTIAAANVDAVGYQMNAAHTGAVTFKTLTMPPDSLWSVDVGGSASYALIVGGRVIVTVAQGNKSQLIALSSATGATLWGPIAYTGAVNAAYDDGYVFVVSGDSLSQTLSALDATTGDPVWTAAVEGTSFTAPPVAADGIVYATNGGIVTAFDETTGAALWHTDIAGTAGTVAVTADGLYAAAPCEAADLQPAVGWQIWLKSSGCSGGGGATPVVANGLVYSPDFIIGTSGTIFDAETGATKTNYSASVIPAFSSTVGFFLSGGKLQGIALADNQRLWSFAGDGDLVTAPIVVNNYVFIGSGHGNLYALDAASGRQMWSTNLGAPIPPLNEQQLIVYTGLAAGDGLLVVPNGSKVTTFMLSRSP